MKEAESSGREPLNLIISRFSTKINALGQKQVQTDTNSLLTIRHSANAASQLVHRP
ncbi:hypothetical protein [Ligilactobacillus murinus]|uniref:hypothetical protein n=2 Tax=Bacillota TaxID=1239 RepID=UPI0022868C3C|nr:hypothetical protein [Ligilactobacillus murinus]MCZ0699571.1 hypothetical protein [Ligilactobacillus murinus]